MAETETEVLPRSTSAEARALVFDTLRLQGWNLEYTVRAPGHLLQYDGSCTAYRGLRSHAVFWGGKGSAEDEATALTHLACRCMAAEEEG